MPLNLIYNLVFFHSSLSVYIISNLCYFSSHLTMIRWSYILKVFIIIIINIFLLKLSLIDHVQQDIIILLELSCNTIARKTKKKTFESVNKIL